MARHLIYLPELNELPGPLTVGGEEAHHTVRVRRLEIGDQVAACDGRGLVVRAAITQIRKAGRSGDWEVHLNPLEWSRIAPVTPRIDVFAASPKGDRLPEMIDGLSQAGAALWRPLLSERTIVDPREGKIDRLRRTAIESLKQCGRAHLLEIGPAVTFDEALRGPGLIMTDASGDPFEPTPQHHATLLIGPEGGWTPDELKRARHAGATIARLGPHTLRIETAAIIAAALTLGRPT